MSEDESPVKPTTSRKRKSLSSTSSRPSKVPKHESTVNTESKAPSRKRKHNDEEASSRSKSRTSDSKSRPSVLSKRLKLQQDKYVQSIQHQREQWTKLMSERQYPVDDEHWDAFCDQYSYYTRDVLLNNIGSEQIDPSIFYTRTTTDDSRSKPSFSNTDDQVVDQAVIKTDDQVVVKTDDPVAHVLKQIVGPDLWIEQGQKTCRCGSTQVAPIEHQGKSGDEGSDFHYKCMTCKTKWKESA
jgi:DNA-directed RNA polymerase subunit M/transcription elongation factor TFIIS